MFVNHEAERRSLRDFQEAQRKAYGNFIADLPAETRRLIPDDWEDIFNSKQAMIFYDAEKYHLDLATVKRPTAREVYNEVFTKPNIWMPKTRLTKEGK